jgi:septum formation protein
LKIVLASASESRARLLRAAGVRFEVVRADIDEEVIKDRMLEAGSSAESITNELAERKARRVSDVRPDYLVIAGDQLLLFEGHLISKCADLVEARSLLVRLRGRRHALIGGLALACRGEIVWRHTSRAELSMRDFSDAYLAQYLGREGPGILGSVGCYRLEGEGAQLFDAIDGSYFAVLGLDMLPLLRALREYKAIAI